MPKSHQSFVVRCWRLANREQRIEIEHIQSGEKRLARSVGEAIEWICAHSPDTRSAIPERSLDMPDES